MTSVYVSVPLVPQLLDEPEKYMLQRPPRESRDLRRMRQQGKESTTPRAGQVGAGMRQRRGARQETAAAL